jgi:methylglutaconyl-CoA hydratase
MAELVHLDVSGGVATITLDSPHNRNALSRALLDELGAHLRTALDDESARVVVLSHTGTVFCSGADLKDPPRPGSGVALPEVLNLLWLSPKPTVARVGGHARAGGIGLVCGCDVSVAARSATFGFSEVRIGVVPAIISAVVTPRLGQTRALELYLTGDTFDAERAAAIGLVTAAADDVDAATQDYVQKLLLGGPSALAATKRLVRGEPLDFAELEGVSLAAFASDEAREGLTAFREKRAARWAES